MLRKNAEISKIPSQMTWIEFLELAKKRRFNKAAKKKYNKRLAEEFPSLSKNIEDKYPYWNAFKHLSYEKVIALPGADSAIGTLYRYVDYTVLKIYATFKKCAKEKKGNSKNQVALITVVRDFGYEGVAPIYQFLNDRHIHWRELQQEAANFITSENMLNTSKEKFEKLLKLNKNNQQALNELKRIEDELDKLRKKDAEYCKVLKKIPGKQGTQARLGKNQSNDTFSPDPEINFHDLNENSTESSEIIEEENDYPSAKYKNQNKKSRRKHSDDESDNDNYPKKRQRKEKSNKNELENASTTTPVMSNQASGPNIMTARGIYEKMKELAKNGIGNEKQGVPLLAAAQALGIFYSDLELFLAERKMKNLGLLAWEFIQTENIYKENIILEIEEAQTDLKKFLKEDETFCKNLDKQDNLLQPNESMTTNTSTINIKLNIPPTWQKEKGELLSNFPNVTLFSPMNTGLQSNRTPSNSEDENMQSNNTTIKL